MPSLKESCRRADALDDNTRNAVQIPYRFCDDGVPAAAGGTEPNDDAESAVRVPQRYAGYAGLPRKVRAEPASGADSDGYIALDVNVALPDPKRHPRPRHGYPLIALMHGCCSGSKTSWHGTIDSPGEKWHYTDAWFAARGYVVLTYTSRGFVNADGEGSTGLTQINHRAYEINDFQYLAGLLAEDPFFGVNPKKIVASGGSYGGGFAWMALTDPTWQSPRRQIGMKLAAVAPRYGWTDLVSSLIPNGRYLQDQLAPPDPAVALSRAPIGSPKRSFLLALYTSGTAGLPPPGAHATFPPEVDQAFACLSSTDPYESNPLCTGVLPGVIDSFLRDRSAYFQTEFFKRITIDRSARIPVFSAGTLSDQLFPMEEHRRMQNLLRSIAPRYQLQEYYGDYNHAVQNKAKEWGDICDADHHVCTANEYRRGFNRAPSDVFRLGVTTRLNRFIDYFAKPPANRKQSRPRSDVTISLQTCVQNAGGLWPLDEPGQRFSADRIEQLAPNVLRLDLPGERQTTSKSTDQHAADADPVSNSLANGATCPSHSDPAGAGVATYTSDPLEGEVTMIGQTRVTTEVSGAGGGAQLNARLYDVFPNGTQVLVDRGVQTLSQPSGTVQLDLHGNAWRFPEGHRIRVELTQDDDPYVKSSNQPSSLTVDGVQLALPIRETAPGEPGESGPTLRVSVGRQSGGGFRVTARSTTGERTGIESYELFVNVDGFVEPLEGEPDSPYRTYLGAPGQTYEFSARATDTRGVPGPLAFTSAQARD